MDTSKHNPTDADMLRIWSKVRPEGECWNYAGAPDKDGYFRIKLQGKKIYAHRLFFELAFGPMPEGKECCHTCRTRGCLNPYHVYAGTSAENVADAIRDGTHRSTHTPPPPQRREAHYAAVLTEERAREIRCARSWGVSIRDLMEVYRVSQTTAYGVAKGERWAEA